MLEAEWEVSSLAGFRDFHPWTRISAGWFGGFDVPPQTLHALLPALLSFSTLATVPTIAIARCGQRGMLIWEDHLKENYHGRQEA